MIDNLITFSQLKRNSFYNYYLIFTDESSSDIKLGNLSNNSSQCTQTPYNNFSPVFSTNTKLLDDFSKFDNLI